jgi:hypothetical protein
LHEQVAHGLIVVDHQHPARFFRGHFSGRL